MALVPSRPAAAQQGYNHHPFQALSYTPLPPREPKAAQSPGRNGDASGTARNKQQLALPPPVTNKITIHCATMIAASWRGFRTRRQLRSLQIYEAFRNKCLIRLQCFRRCIVARRELRKRQELRQRLHEERRVAYAKHQLAELLPQLHWQRGRMEDAAVFLQKWWRWLKQSGGGSDGSKLPRWHERKRGNASKQTEGTGNGKGTTEAAAPASPARDESARMYPGQVVPWVPPQVRYEVATVTEQYVMEHNAESRKNALRKDYYLHQPYSRNRHESNRMAIENYDMNECAAIIQRRWRSHWAEFTVSSRKITTGYFSRYAAVIQRAFRSSLARAKTKRLRAQKDRRLRGKSDAYNAGQVESLLADIVWNRFTLERASEIVQRAWRFYHQKKGARPPYGLLEGTRSPGRRRRKNKKQGEAGSPETSPEVSPEREDDRESKKREAVKLLQSAERRRLAKSEVAEKREKSPHRDVSPRSDAEGEGKSPPK